MRSYTTNTQQAAIAAFFASADWLPYEMEYRNAQWRAKRFLRSGLAVVIATVLVFGAVYGLAPELLKGGTSWALAAGALIGTFVLVCGGFGYIGSQFNYEERRREAIDRIRKEVR
jgi:hypothetical protein